VNIFDQFTHNILRAVDNPPRPGTDDSSFAIAVVTDVGLAGAGDGHDLVTVNYRGTNTRVTHDPDIEFVVGDVVLLARTQPMAILIRLAGTPS
jgi:hypothetical protein